jgi:hypothetical protein
MHVCVVNALLFILISSMRTRKYDTRLWLQKPTKQIPFFEVVFLLNVMTATRLLSSFTLRNGARTIGLFADEGLGPEERRQVEESRRVAEEAERRRVAEVRAHTILCTVYTIMMIDSAVGSHGRPLAHSMTYVPRG